MKLPPWSYSLLSTYKTCPHQAYRRYVVKDIPFVETPEMRRGNAVHKAMEERLESSKPLPADMPYESFALVLDQFQPTLGVEMKLGVTAEGKACDFFAPDVWGRGKVDVVVPQEARAAIYDWKTGKVREEPWELKLHAVLLQARFPALKQIYGCYVWLAEDRIGQTYDLSATLDTWNEVCATVREMEARTAWEKTPNILCGWCAVKDCEHNRSGK